MTRGSGLTLDPSGRFLVLQRQEADGVHLYRRTADGTETRLTLPAGVRAVGNAVWAGGISADGRLLVVMEADDSWFWQPAVVHLDTGRFERVPLAYAGDVETNVTWAGREITALGRRMQASLWRFEPARP